MAQKFLEVPASGIPAQKEATTSSGGAGDAGKLVGLHTDGKININMMPTGVGANTKTIATTEDLSAGNVVNIYNSSGEKCRKADASNGYTADGFVLASTTSGQNATVYLPGAMLSGLTSLTPGALYFLSATAGSVTTTPITAAGQISQCVGKAASATEIIFHPMYPILMA